MGRQHTCGKLAIAIADEAVGSQMEPPRSDSDEDNDTSSAMLALPPMHAELDVAVKGAGSTLHLGIM